MKKSILVLLVCSIAVFCLLHCSTARAGDAPALVINVSQGGDDGGDGSATHPFKTIGRSMKALEKAILAGNDSNIEIRISAGAYHIDAPMQFTSGVYSGGTNVVFHGDASGGTVISGGRDIAVWRNESGNIWSADVKDVIAGRSPFRYLFKDGKRLTRSRYPNGWKMLKISSVNGLGTVVSLKQPPPEKITPQDNDELVVLQNWSISRTMIDHTDTADLSKLNLSARAGFTDHPALIPKAGMACFLENSRSFLDSPGEWYLDASAGKLYYFAEDGENPDNRVFTAPLLEKLVDISGVESAPVKNITFENISFQHSDFSDNSQKYAGMQASFYTREQNSPIYSEPAAIEVSFASNIVFRNCEIAHLGAAGIGLGMGTRDSRIEGCHIHDTGGNGINIGHRLAPVKSLDQDWEKPEFAPDNNIIIKNVVEYCGLSDYGSVGIFMANAQHTLISSNTVAHLPYTGISMGFNWSPAKTTTRDNTVEYNHIYDVMNVLADGGGIYTLGFEPGTVLRKNLIHDVHRSGNTFGGAPNNGIFFDEGTTGIHVEDNIIYGVQRTAATPASEPIRFNNTKKENLTWGMNYFGIGPNNPQFPAELVKEILETAALPPKPDKTE